MGEIREITEKIRRFRDERDWLRFHSHKDMAVGLAVEAAEVLEHFQWQSPEESAAYGSAHRDEVADELADVAMYLFELADNLGVDLHRAIDVKMKKNAEKYPVGLSRGRHAKYTRLQGE